MQSYTVELTVLYITVFCSFCYAGTALFVEGYPDSVRHYIPFMPMDTELEQSPAYQGFLKFWTYIILFQVQV